MKVVFNEATCNQAGECVEEAPEVFSWADDGSLVIKAGAVADDQLVRVRDVCRLCPTQSLRLDEG